MAEANQLASLYLAWTPDGFYLTGAENVGSLPEWFGLPNPPYYKAMLYKLPPDGSCATASCATWIAQLPDICLSGNDIQLLGATALAAGTVHGKEYVAVGMSRNSCPGTGPHGSAWVDGVLVYPGDFSPAQPRTSTAFPSTRATFGRPVR